MSKKKDKNKRKKQLKIRKISRSDDKKSNAMNVLSELPFEVTDEPIDDVIYESLPVDVQDQINELYDKIQLSPKAAIGELNDLLIKYPNIPQIYNYLYASYLYSGNKTKALQIMKKNYEVNPSYLFAKLNYSDYLVESGDINQVSDIYGGKFDLKELYPERNIFHITEVTSFYGVVGYYFAMIGEYGLANQFLRILKGVSPQHGYTLRLMKKIDSANTLIA